MNPFLITEPTAISFSGGRTSAYMLRRVLDANNGLPDCARVLFCNTGKEDEATLNFIHAVETKWCVPIIWLEYVAPSDVKTTTFETAARGGGTISKHYPTSENVAQYSRSVLHG